MKLKRFEVIGEPTFDFMETSNGSVVFYDDIISTILSKVDIEVFDNKYVLDDDEYLEEHYPAQFLIKQLLKEL